MLTDEHWSKLKPILLQHGVYDKASLRPTVEGILYRMRTGCQWRNLPEAFGSWNTAYKRFNAWPAAGTLMTVFSTLVDYPDVEWLFIDGSYVKAHQDSTGPPQSKQKSLVKAVQATPANLIWPSTLTDFPMLSG